MKMITFLMTALPLLLGCVNLQAQQNPFPGEAELANAKAGDLILKTGSYQQRKAEFGMLVVPENREEKGSSLIHLPGGLIRGTVKF